MPLPLLEAAMVLAWSSGFVGVRLAVEAAGVWDAVFWRFVAATACLFLIVLMIDPARRRIDIGRHSVTGLLAMTAFIFGVVMAIDLGVSAGLTALITALQPVTTGLLSGIVLKQPARARQWLGMLIGLAGVGLALSGEIAITAAPIWAYALPFVSMLALTAATMLEERAKRPETGPEDSPVAVLLVHCLGAAMVFSVVAGIDNSPPPADTVTFVMAVAWLVVFSTIGGFGLYWMCLRRTSPVRVATLLYLSPPITMVWAALMFGDPITVVAILGFGVCLFGIWVAGSRATGLRAACAPASCGKTG